MSPNDRDGQGEKGEANGLLQDSEHLVSGKTQLFELHDADGNVPEVHRPVKRRRIFRRYWPHMVAAVAFVTLGIVSFMLWVETSKRFPVIEPGGYLGTISAGVFGKKSAPVPFYVERTPNTDEFFFLVLKDGFEPQLIPAALTDVTGHSPRAVLPVVVIGKDGRLQFSGAQTGEGSYAGSVSNRTTQNQGTWELTRLSAETAYSLDGEKKNEVRLWVMLKRELAMLKSDIVTVSQQVESQKQEIDKLQELLSSGRELRAKVEEKLATAKLELKNQHAKFQERQDEVKRLEAALRVSQYVTDWGKLVSLSRESLEREWRWADSMLGIEASGPGLDVEAEYQRAVGILKLKQEVESEERRISGAQYQPAEGRAEGRAVTEPTNSSVPSLSGNGEGSSSVGNEGLLKWLGIQ